MPSSWQLAAFSLTTFMRHELSRGRQVSTARSYASGVRFMWSLHLGKDPLEGSAIPDQFANASAALSPDPTDGHSLPLPASWLSRLPLPGSEPWEAPAIVMAFIFLWRRSNYSLHYSRTAGGNVYRLCVKHVTTPPGAIQVRLVKDKNVDAHSDHRRFATGTPLCPRLLYCKYSASRRHNHPDAPAFQHPNGEPVSSDDVSSALRRLAAANGATATQLQRYSPHALRKGGTVAARALGYDLAWILREGRWRKLISVEPYIRELAEPRCAAIMQSLLPNVFGSDGAPA